MARTKKEVTGENLVEVGVGELAAEVAPKKRGRKPKAEAEVTENTEVNEEGAEEAPKKRGRAAAKKMVQAPMTFGKRSVRRNTLTIKITLMEDMLGTLPSDENIYTNFIASKDEKMNPEKLNSELEALRRDRTAAFDDGTSVDLEDQGTTVFARNEFDEVCVYDYLIKGFFKNACKALRISDDSQSGSITAFKQKIDNLVFVYPRMIPIHYEGGVDICQRPLRASTPQGERTALRSSESIGKGAYFYVTIVCLSEALLSTIEEWLDYGAFNGLGQWHNSGKGRFMWEEVDESEIPEEELAGHTVLL